MYLCKLPPTTNENADHYAMANDHRTQALGSQWQQLLESSDDERPADLNGYNQNNHLANSFNYSA